MTTGSAVVVSIDIEGRQRYIFETDKLHEMLGASRLMVDALEFADSRQCYGADDRTHLFQPVSGEMKAWADKDDEQVLLERVWRLREWLGSNGIAHTVTMDVVAKRHLFDESNGDPNLQDVVREPDTASLKWVHGRLNATKAGVRRGLRVHDATPRLSLFATCGIHPLDSANEWTTGTTREPRRNVRGDRARAKYEAWDRYKRSTLRGEFVRDVLGKAWKQAVPATLHDLTTVNDLSDEMEAADVEGADQYIAFVCADGDGLGAVLSGINWNSPDWPKGDGVPGTPWERNRAFALALDQALKDAFIEGASKATAKAGTPERLPLLPQVLGGDDFWAVVRRDVAFDFCQTFCERFAENTAASPVIEAARRVAGEGPLTMSAGIAFAKAGHPAESMIEAAETLLGQAKRLRKGRMDGRPEPGIGCIDWHWIQSSVVESVEEAREAGYEYCDSGYRMLLTSRPWSLTQTSLMLAASKIFAEVPRRKREQLEDILRRGWLPSQMAWVAWWRSLTGGEHGEQTRASAVFDTLQQAGFDLPAASGTFQGLVPRLPWIEMPRSAAADAGDKPAIEMMTPLLDLVALPDVVKPPAGSSSKEGH